MIYRPFSKVYPRKIRESYINLLSYLKIKINPDVYLGFTIFAGVLLGLAGAFIISMFYKIIPFFVLWIGLFLFIETLIYIPLMLKVDRNARIIESLLPDALQLMSSNLQSGLTTEQALLSSARPEFGIFEKEINRIGKEVTTGKPL